MFFETQLLFIQLQLFCQKAAEQKNGEALLQIGDYYHDTEMQFDKAFENWKNAADLGNCEAQCRVGSAFKVGEGNRYIHFF